MPKVEETILKLLEKYDGILVYKDYEELYEHMNLLGYSEEAVKKALLDLRRKNIIYYFTRSPGAFSGEKPYLIIKYSRDYARKLGMKNPTVDSYRYRIVTTTFKIEYAKMMGHEPEFKHPLMERRLEAQLPKYV